MGADGSARASAPGPAQHEGGRRANPHTSKDIVHAVRRHGITTGELLRDELHYEDVDKHVKPLVKAGVLERLPRFHGVEPIQLHPESGVLIGVDITNDEAQVAITDAAYGLLEGTVITYGSELLNMKDMEEALASVADLIVVALRGTGAEDGRHVVGVGLSLAGPIRRKEDYTRVSASRAVLASWRDLPIATTLRDLLLERGVVPRDAERRPIVAVENDASAGALGVFTQTLRLYYDARLARPGALGQARMQARWDELQQSRIEDLIYVRVTKGLGVGVVSKGHLVEGGSGFAGELAHVRVDPGGPICPSCGGLGCLETWCSERAFTERLREVGEDEVKDAFRFAGLGRQTNALLQPDGRGGAPAPATHPAVEQAIWDAGWHLGIALSHVCALLNPRLILLGGAMTETKLFNESLIYAIERNTIPLLIENLVVINWRDLVACDDTTHFTPELLGALAKVHDECGDGYYLDPVQRWVDAGGPKDPG
jgi:predicted NBD/HSP70 family sugar kinase